MRSVLAVRIPRWMAGGAVFMSMLSVFLAQGGAPEAGEKWKAPARKAKAANPVEANAESMARGRKLYEANCLSCHGVAGKGDGAEAAKLDRSPGDLTRIEGQTDGELFWKITVGRKPMPAYENTFSEGERWDVVNYTRSLTQAVKK